MSNTIILIVTLVTSIVVTEYINYNQMLGPGLVLTVNVIEKWTTIKDVYCVQWFSFKFKYCAQECEIDAVESASHWPKKNGEKKMRRKNRKSRAQPSARTGTEPVLVNFVRPLCRYNVRSGIRLCPLLTWSWSGYDDKAVPSFSGEIWSSKSSKSVELCGTSVCII